MKLVLAIFLIMQGTAFAGTLADAEKFVNRYPLGPGRGLSLSDSTLSLLRSHGHGTTNKICNGELNFTNYSPAKITKACYISARIWSLILASQKSNTSVRLLIKYAKETLIRSPRHINVVKVLANPFAIVENLIRMIRIRVIESLEEDIVGRECIEGIQCEGFSYAREKAYILRKCAALGNPGKCDDI